MAVLICLFDWKKIEFCEHAQIYSVSNHQNTWLWSKIRNTHVKKSEWPTLVWNPLAWIHGIFWVLQPFDWNVTSNYLPISNCCNIKSNVLHSAHPIRLHFKMDIKLLNWWYAHKPTLNQNSFKKLMPILW